MGKVLVDSDSLTAIGDAIRKKTNQVIKYKPAEMPAAINNINSLKLGGYKVNIAQSDHQTIHVVQSTFSDQESGFTIEDHPTINISLTADPGYIAGSLNLTNFTFLSIKYCSYLFTLSIFRNLTPCVVDDRQYLQLKGHPLDAS